MRKRFSVCLLLCMALLLVLPLTARAGAKLDYVNDYANILPAGTRDTLNAKAAQIAAETGFPVYIVVVEDVDDYVQEGGIEYFSELVFREYELGAGDSGDGILLAMSMEERDYDIYAHGDFGNYAFTDYGKEQLAGTFLDNFRANDWAGGFADYIDNCGVLIAQAKRGDPLDIWIPDPPAPAPRGITPLEGVIIVLVPCVVAGSIVGGFKKQMTTAVRQTRAENYVSHGGLTLRDRSDQFINRTVTRQVVPRATTSSRPGGGHYGGTTVSSSSGGSHHSGKF